MEWMLMPYRRYFDFSGRSRRKEYWMFVLFYLLVSLVLLGLMFGGMGAMDFEDPSARPGPLFFAGAFGIGVFALASFIPALAVQVRRFHDQDKSGWFVLLNLVPYLGGLIVLIFMFLDGTRGPNKYGLDPKDPASAGVFS